MEKSVDAFFTFSHVSRHFIQRQGLFAEPAAVYAARDVTLHIHKGETLGLVGESGCGKSTLARMAVRLLTPTAGDVLLEGNSLFTGPKGFLRSLPQRVQMIFQDPYSSLNPRMKVGESVAEALACAGAGKADQKQKTAEMLALVGLEAHHATRYPHEFSGGQRQRLAIARALITRPDFVVCDEPVSSLDASVQAQVLTLLKDMQDALGLTYLFISHDLAVISHMSDRVAVMHQGQIVEIAPAASLFSTPMHPYTQRLLAAVPGHAHDRPVPEAPPTPQTCAGQQNGPALHAAPCEGLPHSPSAHPEYPSGCSYRSACPLAEPRCAEKTPELAPSCRPDHLLRCCVPGSRGGAL